MALGHNNNARAFAFQLLDLAEKAQNDGQEILRTLKAIAELEAKGVTVTNTQKSNALAAVDVSDVQTAFNTAKATYLSQTDLSA